MIEQTSIVISCVEENKWMQLEKLAAMQNNSTWKLSHKMDQRGPVEQPISQGWQHRAWVHQLQQSSQLEHQDTRSFLLQQTCCKIRHVCVKIILTAQVVYVVGREREPYLSTNTMLGEAFFKSHQSICFPNRCIYGGSIQWPNWSKVDHLLKHISIENKEAFMACIM